MSLLLIPFIIWKFVKYAEANTFINFNDFFSSINNQTNRKIAKFAAGFDITGLVLYIVTLPFYILF